MTAINRNNENQVPEMSSKSSRQKQFLIKDLVDEDQLNMSPDKRSSLSTTSIRERLQRPKSSRAIMEGSTVSCSNPTTQAPSTGPDRKQQQRDPVVSRGLKDQSLSSGNRGETKKKKLDGNMSSDTLNAMFESGLSDDNDNDDNDINNDKFAVSTVSSKGLPLDEEYPEPVKESSADFSPTTTERQVLSLNGISSFSEHSPLHKKANQQLSSAPFIEEITFEPPVSLLGSTTRNNLIQLPKLKSAMKKSVDDNRSRQHPTTTDGAATVQNSPSKQSTEPRNEATTNHSTYSPSKRRNSTSPGRRRRSPSKSSQDRRPSGRHATLSKQKDSSRSITRSASPSKARRASPSQNRGAATPKSKVSPLPAPSKTYTGSSTEKRQSSTMEKITKLLHSPTKLFSADSKRGSSKTHKSDTGKDTARGRSSVKNGAASNKRSSSASPSKKPSNRGGIPKRHLSLGQMETTTILSKEQERRRQLQLRRQQRLSRSKSPRPTRKNSKIDNGIQSVEAMETPASLQRVPSRKQMDFGPNSKTRRKSPKSKTATKPRRHQSLSGMETSPASMLGERMQQMQRNGRGRPTSKSPKRSGQSESGIPKRHSSVGAGAKISPSWMEEEEGQQKQANRSIKRTTKLVRSNRPTSLLERRHSASCLANETSSLDIKGDENIPKLESFTPDESMNSIGRVVAGGVDANGATQQFGMFDDGIEHSRPDTTKSSSSRRILASNDTDHASRPQIQRSIDRRRANSVRQLHAEKESWGKSRPASLRSINKKAISVRQLDAEKDTWKQSRQASLRSVNSKAKSWEQSRPASLRSINKRAHSVRQLNVEKDSWKDSRSTSLRAINRRVNSVRQIETEVENDRWEQSRPVNNSVGRKAARRKTSDSRHTSLKYVPGEVGGTKSLKEKEASGRSRSSRRSQRIEALLSPRQVSRSGRGISPPPEEQSGELQHMQTPATRRLRRSLLQQDLMQDLVIKDPDISESGHASITLEGSDHDAALADNLAQVDANEEVTNSVTAAMSRSGSTLDMDDFIQSRLPNGIKTELMQKTLNRARVGSTRNVLQQ